MWMDVGESPRSIGRMVHVEKNANDAGLLVFVSRTTVCSLSVCVL